MSVTRSWNRLPSELKSRNQWCVSGANKAPMVCDSHGKLFNASINNSEQWLSFNDAVLLADKYKELITTHVDTYGYTRTQTGLDIGFVLTEADPFGCIDLDIKDALSHPNHPDLWTTIESFELFYRILCTFDSFTETSKSGKGYHVWVFGKIGDGVKRDGVEIYSQQRYIICTGNIIVDQNIKNCHTMLQNMATQMKSLSSGHSTAKYELKEIPEDVDDWYILGIAANAANAEKFGRLWKGEWKDLGFPSQSEADIALMSMFTFYSKSNEQCRRLFRESQLGKREKAVKDNRYLDLTLSLIRQREEREAETVKRAEAMSAETIAAERRALAMQTVQNIQGGALHNQRTAPPLHVQGQGEPFISVAPAPVAVLAAGPARVEAEPSVGIPWPPGFAGHIAGFIYNSAPRPVKEVAIVAALGLLAGICGKAWHIPQSGLNLYIILVGRSGVGKEAMHSGTSALINACGSKMPTFHNFVDFKQYSSGPALIKAAAFNPSFVNVCGEWGKYLKRMANETHDGPLSTLRTQMTNLYQKSGPQAIAGGLGYSKADDNIASVSGVSYSMIGESTPDTFYQSLTESMMEDGFLSRFLIIEYEGDRPDLNENPILIPDAPLEDALVRLAFQAQNLITTNTSQPLSRTEQAAKIFADFEKECDSKIRASDDEGWRQMYNRAALKVLRISALLAVADNWVNPVILREHVEWALLVVRKDIGVMSKRIETGDIGLGDLSRDKKIVSILKSYLTEELAPSYKIPVAMQENAIVTRSYLQMRTCRVSAFYNHRLGHSNALEQTIYSCISNGYLMEVDKAKVAENYNFYGKAYRILKLPDYKMQKK